jgi:hypothetical protein
MLYPLEQVTLSDAEAGVLFAPGGSRSVSVESAMVTSWPET